MEETIRTCLYHGYTITPLRWMEEDLKIKTKKEAIEVLNRIVLGFIKEFNKASCPFEIDKANNNNLNKSIYMIVNYFDKMEKPKVEVISENFIRVN